MHALRSILLRMVYSKIFYEILESMQYPIRIRYAIRLRMIQLACSYSMRWYRYTEGCLLTLMVAAAEEFDPKTVRAMQNKLWWKRICTENNLPTPILYATRRNHELVTTEGSRSLEPTTKVVVKPLYSTRGDGIRLATWKCVTSPSFTDNEFLVEQFIDAQEATHTRVITVRDELDNHRVLSCLRVSSDHEFISNLGAVCLCDPPEPIAHDLVSVHRRAIAPHLVCWDVIIDDKNGQYVLEGNWPGGAISWKISDHSVLDEYSKICISHCSQKKCIKQGCRR